MWGVEIRHSMDGTLELPVQVAAGGGWATRLSGRGRGDHRIPLFDAGIPQSLIRELAKGNKYTICQTWGDHVAYAGVIQRTGYDKDSGVLSVQSAELRAAYMDSRMMYGVDDYQGSNVLLSVVDRSHAGAVRAVLNETMSGFRIELPADGAGGFNAEWKFDERLLWEDHLAQIEADGCEVFFRPNIQDGLLTWTTHVDSRVALGSPTVLPVGAPDGRVTHLAVDLDYTEQRTGVLGFGKGGTSAITKFAPTTGSGATDIAVRDIIVNFPDIDDEVRLQAAVDHEYDTLKDPIEQWSFDLRVYPEGPSYAAVGCLLNLGVYGDPFIPDGMHEKRVIALSGDQGFTVRPEVQDGP